MGRKKKEEKMGMSTVTQQVNCHTTEQPSKERKEDSESKSESKSEVKKPSPEKKKVCKPFDHHPLLFQN